MSADRQLTSQYGALDAARAWRAVAALAGRQHGVVGLRQCEAIGVSANAIRKQVGSRVHSVHREVFAVGHRSLGAEGHYMAAVLACGEGAVLSHRSASALLDLRSSAATTLDVTVPGRIGRSRHGLRVHSGDRLDSDEVTEHLGIPCTTVSRTLLDLAWTLDRRGLERVCERADRLQAFDLFSLTRLLNRHRGRRGVARLRAVLAAWDADLSRTRSELEVLFLRLVIDAGIGRPLVNRRVEAGGTAFEVDFHWPRQRLIVETDSKAFHDNPLARKRDANRDRAFATAGWRVRRFNWCDVTEHGPRTRTAVIRALDGRAAAYAP